jgi:phage-related protein
MLAFMPLSLKVLPAIANLLTLVANVVTTLLVPAVNMLIPVIDAIANAFTLAANVLGTIISNVVQGFIDGFQMLWDWADGLVDLFDRYIVQPILRFFGIASPSKLMMDIGIAIMQGLITGVQSLVGAVLGFFLSLPGRILSAVGSLIGMMLSFGRSVLSALWSGISSMAGFIISAASGIAGWVLSGVASLAGKALSAGKDFVEGIWSGISSMAGWIGGLVSGFANGIVNKFKSFFKIGSPSKLMAEQIGKPLAQGVALGFSNELATISPNMSTSLNVAAVGSAVGAAGGITFNGPVQFGSDARSSVGELSWLQRTKMGAA